MRILADPAMQFLSILALCYLYSVSSQGITLRWNVTAVANSKSKGKSSQTILSQVTGKAGRGKLHAILGPSGSGKTTLLSILSETVPKGSLALYGILDRPSSRKDKKKPISVFVQQEDLLFAQLTVQETLSTAAKLKDSNSQKNDADQSLRAVNNSILRLGLKKATNTRVGDAKTRGISGGEKKRLSIGNELINLQNGDKTNADVVVFADEPTSGLDSYQALKVVELLRDLAKDEGYTVIASIHQPRTSIFELFDEITLMSEGRVIYSGEAKAMIGYFTGIGHSCPQYTNPAEYYLDLLSVDYSSPELEASSKKQIHELADIFARSIASADSSAQSNQVDEEFLRSVIVPVKRQGLMGRVSGFMRQFGILFERAFRQIIRDKPTNIARFMSGLFSALLFGSIYFRMGTGAATVADRLGLLQVAAVNTAMTSLIKATTAFVTEKLIVQKERRGKWYDVEPYFISKLLAETPLSAIFPCMSGAIIYLLCGLNPLPGRLWKFLGILVVESMAATALGMSVGSFASSVESAIAIAPAIMVIFIVFGGLYVVNTPSYLKWVPQMSLIRWAYEALCVNEFKDLKLVPAAKQGPLSVSDGSQVLESLGYAKSSVGKAVLAQSAIVLANYLFTYVSVKLQKPSFEALQPYNRFESAKTESVPMIIADPRSEKLDGDLSEEEPLEMNRKDESFGSRQEQPTAMNAAVVRGTLN